MSLNQPALLLAHAESGAPRDSSVQPHSRGNQSTSPDSTRPSSSPIKSLILSSVIQQEDSSPSHPYSSSEDSLPGVTGNELGLVIENMSLKSSEDRLVNFGDRSHQLYLSPSRDNAAGADEQASQGHNSNSVPGDDKEASCLAVAYSSDVSGEVMSEPQPASTLNIPQRAWVPH
ncbi:hypothetical protein ACH5RR_014007 [Cinchona calisaya]|uniref:Uncharacterized protein n=1 Tax=Cinchona calisaya TaxID=153742 RepID=A0ABD3A1M5_9GENT